jgi:AraC-like DNA-binding protein/ABC-type glycerol-3-phosphate transport system substrate-binding protein
MKKRQPSSPASVKSRTLLVGYPFFVREGDQKKYATALRKHLGQEKYFQGTKPVHWKPFITQNPSLLYASQTDLGLVSIQTIGDAAYYARQGLLLPLERLFPDYHNLFLEAGWRKGIVGDHLYSVPSHVSMHLLFYRRDLLRKYSFDPPQTWDDFEKQVAVILKGEKNEKLRGLAVTLSPEMRFVIFLDHVWSQGTDLYESAPQWILNRPAAEKALTRIKGFFQGGIIPKDSLNWDYFEPYREFFEGRSIFMHHWSDGIKMIHELPPEEKARFGWCALPSVDIETPGKSLVAGPNYVIPRHTRFPEAALGILKKITQEDFQCWYAEHFGWPFPGLKSVYQNGKVQQSKPYLGKAEILSRHGKLLEECAYLQANHLDWFNIGGQEIGSLLGSDIHPAEAVHRMERRFASLLPQPLYSGLTAQAIEIIQANLEKPITVGALARQLEITPEHFIRLFKRHTKQTPLQYVNKSKMDRAKILLKESRLNIGEIAYRLGYKSHDHFSRLFRQIVKRSPKEYRS